MGILDKKVFFLFVVTVFIEIGIITLIHSTEYHFLEISILVMLFYIGLIFLIVALYRNFSFKENKDKKIPHVGWVALYCLVDFFFCYNFYIAKLKLLLYKDLFDWLRYPILFIIFLTIFFFICSLVETSDKKKTPLYYNEIVVTCSFIGCVLYFFGTYHVLTYY